MSHCTGPYTRVPFAKKDLKAAEALLQGLAGTGYVMSVRDRPSANGGAEDFNLHADLRTPADADTTWDVRAAKFQGPKRFIGRDYIYEIAVRKRDADNTVRWEGYLFDTTLKALATRLPGDLRHLGDGETVADMLPPKEAQETRIRLCTGA